MENPPHSPLSVAAGSLDYRITENELAADTDMDRLRYKAESTHRTVIVFCQDTHACIVLLLRAGASLDGPAAGGNRPEVILERRIGEIPAPSHPDFLPKMELKLPPQGRPRRRRVAQVDARPAQETPQIALVDRARPSPGAAP